MITFLGLSRAHTRHRPDKPLANLGKFALNLTTQGKLFPNVVQFGQVSFDQMSFGSYHFGQEPIGQLTFDQFAMTIAI